MYRTDITPLSSVVLNCRVNPNIAGSRASIAAKSRYAVIGQSSAAEDGVHNIEAGQLLLADLDENFRTPHDSLSVFGSFNGMSYEPEVSQSEFESKFFFAGVATSAVDVTSYIQASYGVPGQIRGLTTILNTSGQFIKPSDILAWKATSLDPTQRASQYSIFENTRGYRGYSATKFTPTIYVVSPNDISKKYHETAAYAVEHNEDIDIQEFIRSMALGTANTSDLYHNAATMKTFNCFVAYVAIVCAINKGLVIPNTSYNPSNPPIPVDFATTEMIARTLGLVDTPTVASPIAPNQDLIKDITEFSMFGSISAIDAETYARIKTRLYTTFGLVDIDSGPKESTSKMPSETEQILNLFNSVHPNFGASLAHMWDSIYQNAFAMSVGYSRPNEALDILL